MLVEFSIANFRSVKDRITLSMVSAGKPQSKEGFTLKTGFNAAPELVTTAALYGPNGSGKSNIILAMEFFRKFVVESAKDRQQGEAIDVTPFLFSENTQNVPSEFEVSFIHGGYLFQYGFVLDSKKVQEEWLYATPKGGGKEKHQTWFERDKKGIKVDKNLIKGAKEVWKKATRENALFLSTAVQLNAEVFKTPFEWVAESFAVIAKPVLNPYYTVEKSKEKKKKEIILQLMRGLDFSFTDFHIIERELTEGDVEFPKGIPEPIKEKILEDIRKEKHIEILTVHKKEEGGDFLLPFKQESEGTKQLFAYLGPILKILEKGEVLVADEINRSLHPHALCGIVSIFQNKALNKHNAQLVFTSHDTHVMKLLNRDQIWLLDKGEFGATSLTSVSEFAGKADEAVEKRYLSGRYGALPNIEELL